MTDAGPRQATHAARRGTASNLSATRRMPSEKRVEPALDDARGKRGTQILMPRAPRENKARSGFASRRLRSRVSVRRLGCAAEVAEERCRARARASCSVAQRFAIACIER